MRGRKTMTTSRYLPFLLTAMIISVVMATNSLAYKWSTEDKCYTPVDCYSIVHCLDCSKQADLTAISNTKSSDVTEYIGKLKNIDMISINSTAFKITAKLVNGINTKWSIDKIGLDPWFNNSWLNRKNITINETAGKKRINEIIIVNVSGLTLPTNSCLNEIRLTDNNDSVIENDIFDNAGQSNSAGNQWCKILFFANISANQNINYTVYYNNSGATNPNYVDRVIVNGTSHNVTINQTLQYGFQEATPSSINFAKRFDLSNANKIKDSNIDPDNFMPFFDGSTWFFSTASGSGCSVIKDSKLYAELSCGGVALGKEYWRFYANFWSEVNATTSSSLVDRMTGVFKETDHAYFNGVEYTASASNIFTTEGVFVMYNASPSFKDPIGMVVDLSQDGALSYNNVWGISNQSIDWGLGTGSGNFLSGKNITYWFAILENDSSAGNARFYNPFKQWFDGHIANPLMITLGENETISNITPPSPPMPVVTGNISYSYFCSVGNSVENLTVGNVSNYTGLSCNFGCSSDNPIRFMANRIPQGDLCNEQPIIRDIKTIGIFFGAIIGFILTIHVIRRYV